MENFNELIQSGKTVLADFYATWCGPCKAMSPVVDEVQRQLGDLATVVKIDVDKYEALSDAYRIQTVPTFIVFRDGEAKWRHSGIINGKELKMAVEKETRETAPNNPIQNQ